MGSANKMDPTKFKVADLRKTTVCPLAKVIRTKLKKERVTGKIPVVYSTESPTKANKEYLSKIGKQDSEIRKAKIPPASNAFCPSVAGLIAAGLYPNPLPHAHVVTTTTHKTLGGPRGGLILSSCGDEEIYKKLQSSVFPANQGGPLVHIIAAKAVCFKEALEPQYKEYQANVLRNAKAMVEVFKQRGYDVVSNGTENHLFLVSFIKQGLTGKAADAALGKANITVNKNAVPNDPQKPFVTSGIRVGTPSVTRRGFNENDVRELAGWMCDVLDALGKENEEQVIAETKEKVLAICKRLPVYPK